MEILNILQGSDEWLEERLNHKCASEASAMMDESKFMSRNQLLDLKKGWQSNPNSSFKEALFQKGHESEEKARVITELEECDDFPAVVGKTQYSTLTDLLASFDGLNLDYDDALPWEHKEWNETLAENVRNGILEAHYYWQLEHQMLVANCKEMMFTCSDGTEVNRVSMMYKSVPNRRKSLIAGWKQFDIDLESHLLEAKKEMVKTKKESAFPLITFEVTGTQISSNISSCLEMITQKAEVEINRKLESDQDFADKDKLNKATKEARDKLKAMVEDVQGQFISYAEFAGVAADIDKVLQKMQSQGEKQVKQAKDAKKKAIEQGGFNEIQKHITLIQKAINPILIGSVIDSNVDIKSAMKNKRTIESLQNSVDSVVAEFKIYADEIKDNIVMNLSTLRELAGEYEFLFNDSAELVTKENDDLINLIKMRISEHEEAEAKRKAEETEEIERKAKEKAEREAAAKLELKAQAIRNKERAKVEAEQKEKEAVDLLILQEKNSAHSAAIKINTRNEQPVTEILEENFEKPVEQRLTEIFEQESPCCEGLAIEAYEAHKKAEQKWHAYAGELPLGNKRIRAFAIYENIRVAIRVS